MANAQISETMQSPAPGRKKVFIPCIHRPGFDSCVPSYLVREELDGKGNWMSHYNLQRNWPLLKIIGCFESKKEARVAVDVSFYSMKTEGVIDPRASLFKMRREYYPFVANPDDESDNLDDDSSDDERIPYKKACQLPELQKGPTLWSIFPFDMLLTQWALPEVFIASCQNNASCGCAGGDEELEIFGAFQGSAEAREAVDSRKKNIADCLVCDFDDSESEKEDVLSPSKDFLSALLIPDKEIAENWHADGTGCISFHVRSDGCARGIDRVSLRVQKVPNVTASKPMMMLALVKSFRDTLVWLQLCNTQGLPLFSFVQVSPCVSHPFSGSRVIDILTHAERLRVLGCGFKGKLVRLLSLGMGRHCEPQKISGACRKMMQGIARRVAAGLAATVNSKSKSKKRARRDLP